MRFDTRRRQLQRLIEARCSTTAFAVESFLRVESAPSGLFVLGPDVIAARVGLRQRRVALGALLELAALEPAVLVYDELACVGYWLGSAVDSPCAGPRDVDSRRRWASRVLDCPPRARMLAELDAVHPPAPPPAPERQDRRPPAPEPSQQRKLGLELEQRRVVYEEVAQ